ncbi:MAG: guanine deaminase [Elusimicrobia bacterium]|nr:guanine deaminase [Elusimicrobiota bacterium]
MPALRCAVLTPDGRGRLRWFPDGLLAFGADGHIEYCGPFSGAGKLKSGAVSRRGLLAIPGLVDAHCHLPQYPAVAADGLTLLPWLKRHIFPLERNFRGPQARATARMFFSDMAASGTTAACVYTSIWKDSTETCFEEADKSGLRIAMGKVMMDQGSYDAAFKGSASARRDRSLAESDELCRKWHRRDHGRLLYAFTPRFALSCSMELMTRAGELAARRGALVQTHLAENRDELAAVKSKFPGSAHYTDVYGKAGLLGRRSIFAHAIWLSDPEVRALAESGCTLAHCPTSNAFLGSGIMDVPRLEKAGVALALGSDVAAGPSLDLFGVMRESVYLQRVASAHRLFKHAERFGPGRAFAMATLGGARALGLEDKIGTLERGKEADFALLDRRGFEPSCAPAAGGDGVLARLVYRGGRDCVRETYVRGRKVWRA